MKITNVSNVQVAQEDNVKEQFALDVLTGLCSTPKNISAKYFYDDKGSELFQKITSHKDYYPTRTEFEILDSIKDELPKVVGEKEIDLVELGAGDGHKTELVIQGFLNAGVIVNFYPIDISEKAMHLLKKNITAHKNLKIHGIVAEYFQGLRYARTLSTNKQIVLVLGSNIGNFNPAQSQGFLRQLRKTINKSDYALIGFDLKKNIDTLLSAYNDSAGITRDFNLNLLNRMNQELDANFDVSSFEHFGTYNPILGAMESYLISKKDQTVYIGELERTFEFNEMEAIHLEYSFKFLKKDINFLCEHSAFEVVEHFSDKNDYFVDTLWKAI